MNHTEEGGAPLRQQCVARFLPLWASMWPSVGLSDQWEACLVLQVKIGLRKKGDYLTIHDLPQILF